MSLLLLRGVLAFLIPITGDEANFIVWAKNLAGGYHEHPPMIAWILALLLQVHDAMLWLRLPIILFPAVFGWFAYRLTKKYEIGSYVQLVPMHVIPMLMTTDTALIFGSTLCFLAFDRGRITGRSRWFVLAGVGLGMAFLSKYFGVFIIPALLVYLFWSRAPKKMWLGFAITLAAALPAAIYHVYWNSTECWVNFRLHMATRKFDLRSFLWMHFYLALPLVILLRFRFKGVGRAIAKHDGARLATSFCLVPAAIFGLTSFTVGQSLQWAIGFYLVGILALGYVLPPLQIGKAIHILAVGLALHCLPVIGYFLTPVERWSGHPQYKNLVFFFKAPEVVSRLPKNVIVATDSYTLSSVLDYHLRKHVPVLGEGTNHGREDDRIVDFRKFDGKNIAFLTRENPDLRYLHAFFKSVKTEPLTVAGATFYLTQGEGFRFEEYRNKVLAKIRDRYYGPVIGLLGRFPPAACTFSDRYWVH